MITRLLMAEGLWTDACNGFAGETENFDNDILEGWGKGAVLQNAIVEMRMTYNL